MLLDSYHPSHVKRNLPYTLLNRISRIVSNPLLKEIRMNEIISVLIDLKYPIKLLQDAKKKSLVNNTTKIINLCTKQKKSLSFIIKFNKNNQNIINLVRQNFLQLQFLSTTKPIFNDHKLTISYRNNHNILRSLSISTPRVAKCNRPRCGTCSLLITGTCFKFNDNIVLKPNCFINCQSKNLIYFLICSNCSLFYIGETSTELRYRVTLHKQHCRTNYGFLNVNLHIKSCNKKYNNYFHIFSFYKNVNMTKVERKQLEKFYINRFNPPLNHE